MGGSRDSLLLELSGRATLICSKSCRATLSRLDEGARVCEVGVGGCCCDVDIDRRGEEGAAAAERWEVLAARCGRSRSRSRSLGGV